MGYLVLRFWNNELMQNIDGVLQVIMEALEQVESNAVAE
jgi:very-short-patch-repair endonuclease